MLKKFILSLFLLINVSFVWAQEETNEPDTTSVSDKKDVSFETYYYDAINEKVKGNYAEAVELLRLALRFKPNNADVQFEISINYKKMADYKSAILFGENAARLNPENKWYWLNIAELYSAVGDSENTVKSYEKLLELDSKFTVEYIKSVAMTGDVKLALKKVNEYLEKNNSTELLELKRDLLLANKHNEKAIRVTKKLISTNEYNEEYYVELSEIYMSLGKIKEAEKNIDVALKKIPNNPLLIKEKFKILIKKSLYDEAFSVLEKSFENKKITFNEKFGFVLEFVNSNKDPEQTDRLIKLLEYWVDKTGKAKIHPVIANLYMLQSNKEKALISFKKGFDQGYIELPILIEMLILEQELGRYDLLLVDSDKVLEIYPTQSVIYLFKALALNQIKYYDRSIEALETGLDFVVNNEKLKAEFYSMMADGYYNTNRLDTAFKKFEMAIYYDSENIVILNNYSYFLAENSRELDKALEMIKKVISVDGENYTYLDTMAWIYYKKGDFAKANSIFRDMITTRKIEDSDVLEHYGDVLFKLDKVDMAVENWEKAYKLSKDNSALLKEKIKRKSLID